MPDYGKVSNYKGVSWNKNREKWVARIFHDGKCHFIAYFDSDENAAKAYEWYTQLLQDGEELPKTRHKNLYH